MFAFFALVFSLHIYLVFKSRVCVPSAGQMMHRSSVFGWGPKVGCNHERLKLVLEPTWWGDQIPGCILGLKRKKEVSQAADQDTSRVLRSGGIPVMLDLEKGRWGARTYPTPGWSRAARKENGRDYSAATWPTSAWPTSAVMPPKNGSMVHGEVCLLLLGCGFWFFLSFVKVAVINTFTVTANQLTVCNVQEVAQRIPFWICGSLWHFRIVF